MDAATGTLIRLPTGSPVMTDFETLGGKARPYALWPLRLGLGMIFIEAGWSKLTAFSGWEAAVESLGFPVPTVLAALVIVAELLGGIGIVLGVLARFSSAVLTVVLFAAIWTVKWSQGFSGAGWAYDMILMAGTVSIVLNGPGRPTVFTVLERMDLSIEHRLADRIPGLRVLGEGERA